MRLFSWFKKIFTSSTPAKGIKITKDGPYQVTGRIPLSIQTIGVDQAGESEKWIEGEPFGVNEEYHLCRCGKSKNMPFCDFTHAKISFDGRETASFKAYDEMAEKTEGPELTLKDVEVLCAEARFCVREKNAWQFTRESDEPEARKSAVEQACNCPSGRLVACDKHTGKAIEPDFPMSIGVVEDPGAGVSGPLWARGGIRIESADGRVYETRNRVTLCRCGKSKNMPFCDSTHVKAGFKDGLF